MLRIALPNKGTLAEETARLLREAGFRCQRRDGELFVSDSCNDIEFFFLRPRDITTYVGRGLLDLGVTGRDLALDSEVPVVELLALNFGHSAFCFAVPHGSELTPMDFGSLRIATAFPQLVKRWLDQHNISAQIIRLDGAVEISIQLGVADAIADIVESGKTIRQTGLKAVGEPLLISEAILIGRDGATIERPVVKTLVDRLQGIVIARKYAMLEYDIPEALLEEATALTPGIESPTVSRLYKPNWVAVKAMVQQAEVNRLLDELHDLGAKGILVTRIQTCRL